MAHRTRTTGTGHGGRSRHVQKGGDSQGRWYDVRSYAHVMPAPARVRAIKTAHAGRASVNRAACPLSRLDASVEYMID